MGNWGLSLRPAVRPHTSYFTARYNTASEAIKKEISKEIKRLEEDFVKKHGALKHPNDLVAYAKKRLNTAHFASQYGYSFYPEEWIRQYVYYNGKDYSVRAEGEEKKYKIPLVLRPKPVTAFDRAFGLDQKVRGYFGYDPLPVLAFSTEEEIKKRIADEKRVKSIKIDKKLENLEYLQDKYIRKYGSIVNADHFAEFVRDHNSTLINNRQTSLFSPDPNPEKLLYKIDDIKRHLSANGNHWVVTNSTIDPNSERYLRPMKPNVEHQKIRDEALGILPKIDTRVDVKPPYAPPYEVSKVKEQSVSHHDDLPSTIDSIPGSAVGDSIIPPGVVPVDSVQRQADMPMQYLYSVQPEQQGQAKNQQQQQAQQPAATGTQKKAKVKQQAKNQQQGQSQAKTQNQQQQQAQNQQQQQAQNQQQQQAQNQEQQQTQNQEQQQTQNQEQAETAEKKEEVKKEGSETPSSIEWDPIKAHLKTKEGQKKRDLTYEDYLIPNIYNLPSDHNIVSEALASIRQYEQAQASLADDANVQPVASNQVASTGGLKTAWTNKLANFFRQGKQYLPTLGDAVSSIGLMSGMYNNLRNTYLEQASSLPNINPYVNYGLGTLAGLDDQRQFVNAQFDTYGNDMRSQYDSMMRQVSNNARGMNQSRAMRLSSLSDYADRSWKNELQRLSQLNNISQQRNNVMTQRDQYLAQGEQAKHQANQQDIASFYSNLNNAQNGVAQGWQNVGKHLNHYALEGARMNILNQYSPYGIQSDRYGRLYAVRPEEEQYR